MSITETEPMSEETYRQFALGDPQGQWELYRGQLREKPGISVEHGDIMDRLLAYPYEQLDRNEYRIRINHARLRRSADTYYIPDIAVIPTPVVQALLERPGALDAYPEPLPLVVEIWSPSTGGYDINEKLPDYQQRGDLEIWYVHPYERTVTAWRRNRRGSTQRRSTVMESCVRNRRLAWPSTSTRSSRRNVIETRCGQISNTRAPISTTAGSPV